MALTKIEFGSLADPDVVNNNFEYLEEMITDTSAKIYTNNTSLESKISTLSSNLNEKIDDLNDQVLGGVETDISTINKEISNINTKISKILTGIAPNFTAGKAITDNTDFTAPSCGWVYWSGSTGQGPIYLSVNGKNVLTVGAFGSKDTTLCTLPIYVTKGDVVRTTSSAYLGAVFYPCKGGF